MTAKGCSKCNEGKIPLFTSLVDCHHCSSTKQYPSLHDGRFYRMNPEEERCNYELPEDSWIAFPSRTPDLHWFNTGKFGAITDRRAVFGIPGDRPQVGSDLFHVAPVLTRPPFGAWGDRFYYLTRDRLQCVKYVYLNQCNAVCMVNVRDGQEVNLGEARWNYRTWCDVEYQQRHPVSQGKHGHTWNELLDWLAAQMLEKGIE